MRSTWSMCGLTIFASLGMSLFPSPEAMAGTDDGGSSEGVMVIETPDGGIQPQAAIDAKGVIHLIYFQGLPSSGDLFYAPRGPSETRFSPPTRVNSQPRRRYRDGDDPWRPDRDGQRGKSPRRLERLDRRPAQEPLPWPTDALHTLQLRRDRIRAAAEPDAATTVLDGGGTIAADGEGNVYVAWHARSKGAPAGEAGRRMWLTHSEDEGATFPPEEPAWDRQTSGMRLLRHPRSWRTVRVRSTSCTEPPPTATSGTCTCSLPTTGPATSEARRSTPGSSTPVR